MLMGDSAADELEAILLRQRRRYTSREVAELAGVPVYRARRFWRALGFANVDDEAVEFTDEDLDSLMVLLRLAAADDDDHALTLARSVGRTAARLAEAQAELNVERLDLAGVPAEKRADVLRQKIAEELPELERLLSYAWRRQLAASVGRILQPVHDSAAAPLAVGFADLVGFTRLSRQLPAPELARLVDTFEGRSADLVTAGHGRIIKTLGDSVMFVADAAEHAAEIALELVEAHSRVKIIPPIRVGIAFGPVLARMGDVFGSTVNLASRLTALAEPDKILIDAEMVIGLADASSFELTSVGRLAVRGVGDLTAFTLARRPRPH